MPPIHQPDSKTFSCNDSIAPVFQGRYIAASSTTTNRLLCYKSICSILASLALVHLKGLVLRALEGFIHHNDEMAAVK